MHLWLVYIVVCKIGLCAPLINFLLLINYSNQFKAQRGREKLMYDYLTTKDQFWMMNEWLVPHFPLGSPVSTCCHRWVVTALCAVTTAVSPLPTPSNNITTSHLCCCLYFLLSRGIIAEPEWDNSSPSPDTDNFILLSARETGCFDKILRAESRILLIGPNYLVVEHKIMWQPIHGKWP